MEQDRPAGRFRFVAFALLIGFAAVIGRVGYLQLGNVETGRAEFSSLHTTSVRLSAVRGEVYDRRGLPLAVNQPETILIAEPFNIKNKAHVAQELSGVLGVRADEILRKLSDERYRKYCRLANKLDWATIQKVMDLRLSGLHYEENPQRAYPQGSLAGPLVGYISDSTGVAGIEKSYDQTLRGLSAITKVTAVNQRLKMAETDYSRVAGLRGADLVLTIDGYLQHVVERELAKGVEEFEAKGAMGILMNCRNGEILAMGQWPPFDPNDRSTGMRDKNICVSDFFEPGSVMKPFTFAMAFDAEVITESTVINCENGNWYYKPGRKSIGDMAGHGKGRITAAEILSHSNNVGTAKISAEWMPHGDGQYPLREFLFGIGFGEPTLCGLPGESAGMLRKQWWPIDRATVSYGHGIAVTAAQLASRFSMIGNGGVLPRAHLVLGRRSSMSGEFFPEEYEAPRRVISEQAADRTLALLRLAVTEGTGKNLELPGYRFAGKTGTAIVPDPNGGGYLDNEVFCSFAGFLPYPDPEYVLLVTLDRPVFHYEHIKSSRNYATGGKTAGPVWTRIAMDALHYLGVPPDPALLPETTQVAAKDR